jgi:hypothetical protein
VNPRAGLDDVEKRKFLTLPGLETLKDHRENDLIDFGKFASLGWLRHCATSRKVAVSIRDEFIGFFNLSYPSSRTMALGSTQPLTEMSTRNLSGDKWWPARKADILTAICEPIV